MAAVDEIAIKLGVKTGDLKAALTDAGASIKKFKKEGESSDNDGLLGTVKKSTKSLQDLKNLLAGGAIAGAVKGFFSLAIEGAKASKDATDSNAAAVREFAAGLESVKSVATSLAITVIGTVNKLGLALGDVVNIARSFLVNGTEGFEVWARTADAIEATAAAAEEAEERLAETRKRNGAEFLAITKELASIEEKSQAQRLKGLDVYETERNLFIELSRIRQEIRNYDGDAIGRRRLALDLAKTQLAADDATLAVKKAQADVEKKMAEDAIKLGIQMKKDQDERIKDAEELSAKQTLGAEMDLELFQLRSKNADTLTAAERTRLRVLEAQLAEKKMQVEIDELHDKLIRGSITTAERARLAELLKQKDAIASQKAIKEAMTANTAGPELAAEQAITSERQRQLDIAKEEAAVAAQTEASRRGTITNKGDVRNLDDIQLDQLIANLNKSLGTIRTNDRNVGGVGTTIGSYKSIEQLMLQNNLDQAMKEMNLRRAFGRTQSIFGDEAAKRTFAPGEYERLAQLFNPDQQKKQAADIGAIAGTLKNLFPEQYSGIR